METKFQVFAISLPTRRFDEKTHLLWKNKNGQLLHTHISEKTDFIAQHLYLVSDGDDKKEGWRVCMMPDGAYSVAKPEAPFNPFSHKIIASTDNSLSLPIIPDWFIEEYIEKKREVGNIYISLDSEGKPDTTLIEGLLNIKIIVIPKKEEFSRLEIPEIIHKFVNDVKLGPVVIDKVKWWFNKNY